MSEQIDTRIPVSVITGFLGAGKSTLLNRLPRHPDMGETAVIVNEFGEIGLDHALIASSQEDTILLSSGCLCCTVRGDLVNTFRDLAAKRDRGEVKPFKRVVIETTGLADPAPVLHTLMSDPVVAERCRLESVVTLVDAVNGDGTLDHHKEAIKQAAVADRLVLTKVDLAEPKAVQHLRHRLRHLNPGARSSPRLAATSRRSSSLMPAFTTLPQRASMYRTGCVPRPMARITTIITITIMITMATITIMGTIMGTITTMTTTMITDISSSRMAASMSIGTIQASGLSA